MFPLIFSRDPKIVEMVIISYNTLYLVGKDEKQRARKLLGLMRESTVVEVTCLEEYLKRVREDESLELKRVYYELWKIYKEGGDEIEGQVKRQVQGAKTIDKVKAEEEIKIKLEI